MIKTNLPYLFLGLLVVLGLAHIGYSESIASSNIPNTSLYFVIILCIGILLIWPQNKNRYQFSLGDAFLASYVVWLFIAYFLSDIKYYAWSGLPILMALPVTALTWRVLRDQGLEWSKFSKILDAIFVLLCAWALLDFIAFEKRSSAIFYDPNAFAALLNIRLIPLIVTTSLEKTNERCFWNYYFIGFLALSMFMTQSRGALLAFGAVIISFGLFISFKRIEAKNFLISILIVLSIFTVLQASDLQHSDRISQRLVGMDNSTSLRLFMLGKGIEIYNENDRLFGVGLGGFGSYYQENRYPRDLTTFGSMAHNDYIQFLVEGGPLHVIFLVSLMCFMPMYYLYKSSKHKKKTVISSNEVRTWSLSLALLYLSLHAVVNFIFLVMGIAVLAGIYIGELIFINSERRRVVTNAISRKIIAYMVVIGSLFMIYKAMIELATFSIFRSDDSVIYDMKLDKTIPIAKLFYVLNPGNPRPLYFLSMAYMRMSEKVDDDQARYLLLNNLNKTTQWLLDENSRDVKALLLRAKYYEISKGRDYPEIHFLVERAEKLDPAIGDGEVYLQLFNQEGFIDRP